jgi:hypothetical protein
MNPVARQNPNPPAKSTGWQCVHKLLSAMNMAQVLPLAGSGLALHSFPWKALDGELGTAAAVECAKALASSSEAHAGRTDFFWLLARRRWSGWKGAPHLGQSRDSGSLPSGWLSGYWSMFSKRAKDSLVSIWCPVCRVPGRLSGILETIRESGYPPAC